VWCRVPPGEHAPAGIARAAFTGFCNWLVAPPHRGIHHVHNLWGKHSKRQYLSWSQRGAGQACCRFSGYGAVRKNAPHMARDRPRISQIDPSPWRAKRYISTSPRDAEKSTISECIPFTMRCASGRNLKRIASGAPVLWSDHAPVDLSVLTARPFLRPPGWHLTVPQTWSGS